MSGRPGLARGVIAIALVAGGCLPAAATSQGRQVELLYAGFLVIAAGIAVLVFGLATWAIVRYRDRGGPAAPAAGDPEAAGPPRHPVDGRPIPPQTRGNLKLEIIWTALPVITVLVLFGATLLVLNTVEARSERPAADLRVEGFRWGWTFSYPDEDVLVSGIGEPGPEVVVPVGEPIRITLTAEDVNHAFFVPRFLFKRDAIPGRENVFELTIEEPGAYGGQCAEFCGIFHARMPFTIRAVPRPEYDAWLAAQPRGGIIPSVPPDPPIASPASASPTVEPQQPLESGG